MSRAAALRFSIDLESEIRKITQRQHLNQVHYLVQLVRHALSRRPESIHVRIDKRFLVLSQDGESFPEDEWQLLQGLLRPESLSVTECQRALGKLEEYHGVAFLSLMMNAPRLEIQSGDTEWTCSMGRIQHLRRIAPIKGYRLRLVREGAAPREEAAELRFYCSGASAPLYLNGKKINRPFSFDGQILILRFRHHSGHGAVGLPLEGDLRSITLFKQGVRLGVKHSRPDGGLIFHGWWNSSLTHFESDYRESIERGERHLAFHVQRLYRQIGNHFASLGDPQKIRVKKLLLGLDGDSWQERFGKIPLFHACGKPFSLSLQDLLRLNPHFEGIPFNSRPGGGIPFLPYLLPEDILFLHEKLQLETRQCRAPRGRWPHRLFDFFKRRPRRVPSHTPVEAGPDQKLLLRALHQDDPFCRYSFIQGPSRVVRDRKCRDWVLLQVDHPLVIEAVRTHERQPEMLPLLKHRLKALAK